MHKPHSLKQVQDRYHLDVSIEGPNIILILKVLGEGIYRHYHASINTASLPAEIASYYQTNENIFEALSEKQNFEVDCEKGTMMLYAHTYQKNKLITKGTPIQFHQVHPDQVNQYQHLVKNVQHLKTNFKILKDQEEKKGKKMEESLLKVERTLNELEQVSKQLIVSKLQTPQPEEKEQPIFMETSFKKKFEVQGRKVTYKGEDNKWTQLLINIPIEKGGVLKLRFLIVKSRLGYVNLGIVDETKQKNSRCSIKSGNVITYTGKSKQIHSGKKQLNDQGKGFKTGEVVQMEINAKAGLISWRTDELLAEVEMMVNNIHQWRPYVEFGNSGDCVELLSS